MVGNPQHATLVANAVTMLTFDADFAAVEVLNVDGVAAVYFTVGAGSAPSPAVAGTGSHVLPAAIGSIEISVTGAGTTTVRLISAGTPMVSVRGIDPQ